MEPTPADLPRGKVPLASEAIQKVGVTPHSPIDFSPCLQLCVEAADVFGQVPVGVSGVFAGDHAVQF